MGWILGVIQLGVSIYGAVRRRKQAIEEKEAREELADINIAQQQLSEKTRIEQLETQRDTTVSRQQARTGRGGLTAEGSPLIVEQSILETFGTRGTIGRAQIAPGVAGEEVVGGSGAIGNVQAQGALARNAIRAGENLANIGSYSDADLGLDILATTLDAATSIYRFNQLKKDTRITTTDPFRQANVPTNQLDQFYNDFRYDVPTSQLDQFYGGYQGIDYSIPNYWMTAGQI